MLASRQQALSKMQKMHHKTFEINDLQITKRKNIMAHNKSALKRIKTDAKKRTQNRARKSAVATLERKFLAFLEGSQFTEATATLQACFSAYDKAAKKGVIKKEKVDRKKSRLAKALNRAQA